MIHIKGANVHNLKNIEVKIPRNQLVVITGLSGSGKSSLAFDTLYAEGQRRYVESLSSYARQFLGRMQKPEVDFIKGLPPAIAIEQKVNSRNPRSTVGTSTEIYEYLKLLFARIGKTYSPISGNLVVKHQLQDVVDCAMNQENGTRIMLLIRINTSVNADELQAKLELLQKQGFARLLLDGKPQRLQDLNENKTTFTPENELLLVIDRIVSDGQKTTANRFADSVETAFFEGDGTCMLRILKPSGDEDISFSNKFEADGMQFEEPTQHLFNFNNPLGACPRCEGFGKVVGIDPDLVVPNKNMSIYEGAIACWRGEKMSEWNNDLVMNADKFNFPIHKPYYELTQAQRNLIWLGNKYFHGLNDFFAYLEKKQYAGIQYRVMLSRYRGKTLCPECLGTRLRKEANYVQVAGKTIPQIVEMPIVQLQKFFAELELNETDAITAKRLLTEIRNRLQFLLDVGLSYLTLNRLSNSLSGGESQRINLVTSIGNSLVGSLYILDEPSIGLHPKDTAKLIKVLHQLRDLGNTVVVVEHDEEIMRASDYLIDIGPNAGRIGGEVVFTSPISKLQSALKESLDKSYTASYLTGLRKIDVPAMRRPWNNYVEVLGATENNLKDLSVKFPLNVMTVVTGVSGSGKSSLVHKVLYLALKKHYGGVADRTGEFGSLRGSMHLANDIEFVDQNPIGKSSRSNPVTYIKAYDDIRKLYASQQLSKQMAYAPSHFSFNTAGGRCEECQGEGTVTIEMQFMADLVLECEHCHGKRFKSDILEVQYRGKSIFDMLDMTINQAIEFLSEDLGTTEKKIVNRLKALQNVGIGYIKLGQSSSTLSGGESQRVKLASFLANEKTQPTIFVFDEPTTGLHIHDVKTLLKAFDALIERGHTVIIIEHNLDVIKCADHIIDLGPEGGDKGGQIVFEGTPEEIVKCKKSHTGVALKGLV